MVETILKTFLIAMTPVLEIRGAIPVGVTGGLDPWLAYFVGVVGNMLPIPILVILTRRILLWLRRFRPFKKITDFLEGKAEKNRKLVDKYEFWGLVVLVAIPLPGTGAWTGALVASFMSMRLRNCIPAITLGVVIAGLIVLATTCGIIHLSA